jgi:hypothetical protein
MAAAHHPNPRPRLFDIVDPRRFSWGHHSHGRFSPPLNRHSQFKANARQNWRSFDARLNQMWFKLELMAVDSNFIERRATA